jgi:anti-anti-sigma regulatory factor
MNLAQHEEEGRLVLAISGKCTVEHAATLRDALLAAAGPGKALALDVSGVEDADLTFLQLLLATAQTLDKRGTCLTRLGTIPQVLAEAARVSGFDRTPRLSAFFATEGRPCPGQIA